MNRARSEIAVMKWMGWNLENLRTAPNSYVNQIIKMMIEESDRIKHPEDYEDDD